MIPGRSAFIHTIGHETDTGAVCPFALGLLSQGHGPFCGGFGITAYCRGVNASGQGLFSDGNGIGAVGFSLGSGSDGNGIQSRSPGAAPYSQSPFPFGMGIIAQGRGAHGPICISPGSNSQRIRSHRTIVQVIPIPVAIFRVHTEIMNGSRGTFCTFSGFRRQNRSGVQQRQPAKGRQQQFFQPATLPLPGFTAASRTTGNQFGPHHIAVPGFVPYHFEDPVHTPAPPYEAMVRRKIEISVFILCFFTSVL